MNTWRNNHATGKTIKYTWGTTTYKENYFEYSCEYESFYPKEKWVVNIPKIVMQTFDNEYKETNQFSEVEVILSKKDELSFQIKQKARYYQKRNEFFQFCDKRIDDILIIIILLANFINIFTGNLQLEYNIHLNNIIKILKMIIKLNNKIKRYSEISQQYIDLAAKLNAVSSEEGLEQIKTTLAYIEENEPKLLVVLMKICWNEEAAYRGMPPDKFFKIGPIQRLCAQFFDLNPSSIHAQKKVKE